MCVRFTHRYTWREIHRLYSLTSPASNLQPSYNVCPTDTVNVVTSQDGKRILQPMRWGLVLTRWGVEMASKGGVPADRVLNCLTLSEFTQFLRERKPARAQAA
jgi:putative SOS response-associated peptidase YedK